ncbi:MAG: 3D domain-containing protein [Planctomycetota bacterium]
MYRNMVRNYYIKKKRFLLLLICFVFLSFISGCGSGQNTVEVIATAFNSVSNQTNKNPTIMAWGDTLKPGMKAIAVSRDLIDLGLVYNTNVAIEGLQGKYKVLDKMNKKWKMKIDIYMGTDIKAAKEWGKKRVKISW